MCYLQKVPSVNLDQPQVANLMLVTSSEAQKYGNELTVVQDNFEVNCAAAPEIGHCQQISRNKQLLETISMCSLKVQKNSLLVYPKWGKKPSRVSTRLA